MSRINQKHFYANYRVKVYGKGLNTLAGLPLFLSLVGDDLASRLLERCDKHGKDKEVFKLRRGIKITIYVK